jgi:hypothetical protein
MVEEEKQQQQQQQKNIKLNGKFIYVAYKGQTISNPQGWYLVRDKVQGEGEPIWTG